MKIQPPSIDETLASIKKSLEKRSNEAVVYLPGYLEYKRGAPNSFLRSALFAAIKGQDRKFIKSEVLASQNGIVVKFTGEQLNQTDLDVWEALVHLAREQPLGSRCVFTAYNLLKTLGMSTGKSQYKQLHEMITRLTACAVEISHNNKTYIGSLIESGIKDELTKFYDIKLSKDLINLFGDTQWTAIDWEQRKLLKEQPLTQALHSFYSSHKKPFPLKLETLKSYTGSHNKELRDFKYKVKKSLSKLVEIGFLNSYQIVGDMVHVERQFSRSIEYTEE